MTCRPIGCLLAESLIAILERCARNPVFQMLNEGRPEAMGESLGISEAYGFRRSRELGNHCLWCDEFFTAIAPELLHHGAVTERGRVDLDVDLDALKRIRPAPENPAKRIATRAFDLKELVVDARSSDERSVAGRSPIRPGSNDCDPSYRTGQDDH